MNSGNSSWIKNVSLPAPSLGDNTADADRLSHALKQLLDTDFIEIGLDLLRTIPALLRQWNYRARCVVFKERDRWILLDLLDPGAPENAFGVAIDLGTTRIALRVLGLASGKIVYESSFDNPQIGIGPDVLTRIHYAQSPAGLQEMSRLVVDGINGMLAEACREAELSLKEIHLVSVAGNTVMTHLLLQLNPWWIIREPYIPVVNRPGIFKAEELGILAGPLARVFVFPNIGSYFGGDLIAGILYSGMIRRDDTSILVDVGTNAEVVLGNRNWLVGCAGAAGPALEGGVTRMGMNAAPGVIDRVSIDRNTRRPEVHVIGEERPRGICGSGLIDLAAQLFLSGMVDIRGKFVKDACGDRLRRMEEIDHFVLVPAEESATGFELTISQADLDSLVRSKAAMYTILGTITGTVGLSPNDLETFYVAGTFGSFIDPGSAIAIGMIPDLPLSSYKTLGNSSLGGASMMLESSEHMDEIDRIRDSITYLELNVNQEFMNAFSGAKFIPHTDKTLFPSVPVP